MSEVRYRITDHAYAEAEARGIPLSVLQSVVESPEQIVDAHSERSVYQSKVDINGKRYLVRAIVENTDPLTIVTVYRTSKIEKYWRDEP
jgi:hypothetical protein